MIRLKIKEVAQEKGIGLAKLARLADMDIKTVRKFFHDPYTSLNTTTLDKLAEALGVDASTLLESVSGQDQEQKREGGQ